MAAQLQSLDCGRFAPVVTVWRDNKGTSVLAASEIDLAELERIVSDAKNTRPSKDELPLLKLARFGNKRTDKGSLRHDENVTAVYGIEGDYDGQKLSMQHAADVLSSMGLAAVLYASPRWQPDAPKWRVIVPLAQPLEGTTAQIQAQHEHWIGVLNAVLGGVLSGESYTLSQSYYFGRVANTPERPVIRLEGCALDQLEDAPLPVPKPNGQPSAKGIGEHKPAATLDGIATGEHIYNVGRNYVGRLVSKGMEPAEVEELMRGYLLGNKGVWQSDSTQQARWQEAWDKLPRWIEGAERKFSPDEVQLPEEWPEPVNILAELAAPRFEASDLPRGLAEYPAAYAASTGIDRSITLTAAVTTAAAALSDEFQIVADPKTRWYQSARLWTLTIARPGAGKTPGQREMLSPLWTLQRELRERHQAVCAGLPDDEKPPPEPKLIVVDTTIEALSEVLRHTSRGVLIANDEFEGWMGSMDAYRKGGASRDRGEWLRSFDGGPHSIERVQRGSVHVDNWGVSILSATTPAALSKLARHLPEDGLLQRFIPVCAQRQGLGSESGVDVAEARTRYEETLRRLFHAAPQAHAGKVQLSFEAHAEFKQWRQRNQLLQEAMGSSSPAFEAHLAKYPALVLRTALVFHAATIVSMDSPAARDIGAWPVSVETMKQAIAFMRRASQHAMALYLGMKGGSEAFELAREIGRAVIAQGSSQIARRDLLRTVRAFRAAEPHQQGAALHVLVDGGWLREAEGGYTKAHPTRYDINPLLSQRMRTEAERERDRRAAVREAIAECVNERVND